MLKEPRWFARLRNGLKPPGERLDFSARRARSIHLIALTIALAALAAQGVLFLDGSLGRAWMPLSSGAALGLFALVVNRRGGRVLAGWLLAWGLVAVQTWLLFTGNGIHDLAVTLYPIIMIIISQVLEGRSARLGYLLVFASAGLVVFGELAGWLKTDFTNPLTDPADFFSLALILGMTAVGLSLIEHYLQSSFGLANQNARALRASEERYRLLAEHLERRTRQLTVINRIASEVSRLQSLESVLEMARVHLQAALPLDVFIVTLWDEATGEISYPMLYDQGKVYQEPSHPLKPGSWFHQVITKRQPVLINRTLEEMEDRQGFRMVGDTSRVSASLLLAPLRVGERVIGVVSTQSYTLNAYTHEHQEFLVAAAAQIGIAIENARLYAQSQAELEERQRSEAALRQRTEQLAALNQISRSIASLQGLDELLQTILQQLQMAFPVDAFFVGFLDPEQNCLRFPFVYDAGQFYQMEPRPIRPGSWTGQCVHEGRTVFILRTPQEVESALSSGRIGDTSRVSASIMMAPLQVGERCIGVVSAQSYALNAYTPENLDFLQSAASQIAIALENARLYAELQAELSERQRSEAMLRQNEARLRALVENVPYDLWMCDSQGSFIFQSAVSHRLMGNALGKRLADLELPPEIHQRWLDLHQRAFEGQIVLEDTEWKLNGDARAFITMLAPVREGDLLMGLVGVNIDVTDLKRSEEAIRHYAERVAVLHEIDQAILAVRSPQEIAVAALSRLHRLVPCSSASLALLDTDAQTAQIVATFAEGKTLPGSSEMIPFHDPDRLELLLRGEVVYITDLVTQPLEGPPSLNRVLLQGPIYAIIAVPLSYQGKLVGVLSVGAAQRGNLSPQDVQIVQEIATQLAISIHQAQLTADIQQLNVTLEKRVLQRTAELEAAYKELEAFSYSVSHDLRAPLRGITGYMKLLLEDFGQTFTPEALNYLNKIEASAQRMNNLIDDMLSLSRVGRQEVQRTRFKMGDLVQQVLNEALANYDPARLRITVYPLPSVKADPSLLRQVLQNLLDNALKYSRTRMVAEIEIGSFPQDGEMVFYIRDNGVGFDMEFANKLFLPFERLHRQDEFEGNGIGLAIVRRILQRHNGRIWAQAAPGEGATFYFTLGE